MNLSISRLMRMLSLAICSLGLLSLLAACDLFGGGSNNATPTPTPTPAPQLKAYAGQGFKISYPSTWQVKEDSNLSLVTFKDPITQSFFLVQTTPNPGGLVSSDQVIVGAEEVMKADGLKNVKDQGNASDVTVGGQQWKQKKLSADATQDGKTVPIRTAVLTNNHPPASPQTKTYTLAYGAAEALYQAVDSADFQPMLQSFQFSS